MKISQVNFNSKSIPTKYFVGSLPGNTQTQALEMHFSKYGKVVSLEIIKNPKTSLSKGYGFLLIQLYLPESEFICIEHYFANRVISVRPYMKGKDLQQNTLSFLSKRLFVKRVPEWMNEQDLYEYFVQFGPIEMVYVTPNFAVKQLNSLIGFVHFVQKASLDDVLQSEMHYIKGRPVKCSAYDREKAKKTVLDENKAISGRGGRLCLDDSCDILEEQNRNGTTKTSFGHSLQEKVTFSDNSSRIPSSLSPSSSPKIQARPRGRRLESIHELYQIQNKAGYSEARNNLELGRCRIKNPQQNPLNSTQQENPNSKERQEFLHTCSKLLHGSENLRFNHPAINTSIQRQVSRRVYQSDSPSAHFFTVHRN
jgi:RNA recognition motif-containing protein